MTDTESVREGRREGSEEDAAVTVFVPAYNEAATLAGAVEDVRSACAVLRDHEIIIVDDGSTDGTGAVADRLARTFPNIRVIYNPRNLGLAAGYRVALAEARMPYYTFVPCDREVSQESIGHILAMMGSADIVVPCHANVEARPWHRRLLTWASTGLINRLFGLSLGYYQGPCVYPTALARLITTTTTGFFFLAEMLVQAVLAGHSVVEVGLIHQQRTQGRSKAVSLRNILTALATVLRLWWAVRLGRNAGRLREYRA